MDRRSIVRGKAEQIGYELLLASLHDQLRNDALSALRAEGASLPEETAIQMAIRESQWDDPSGNV
jgi:hypothetical protein